MERPGARPQFDVAQEAKVYSRIGVPYGPVVRHREAGRIGFKSQVARKVIVRAQAQRRRNNRLRSGSDQADGIARCRVDNHIAVGVVIVLGRVEGGYHRNILHLPQGFQPEFPAAHRIRPSQEFIGKLGIGKFIIRRQVFAGEVGLAP